MTRGWRWLGWVLLTLAGAAVVGIGISISMFSRWSEVVPAAPEKAERAFTRARGAAGGGPAYVEILPTGEVLVHRDQEGGEARSLDFLHLMAWEPENEKILRVSFPFWFVRVKINDTVNLGTITTALAGDWRNLDLRVSVRDLERRGPGIVLDHRLEDGTLLLLWTEGEQEP